VLAAAKFSPAVMKPWLDVSDLASFGFPPIVNSAILPPEIIIFQTILDMIIQVAAGWKPTRKQSSLTALG
jgi:hypothetical protein